MAFRSRLIITGQERHLLNQTRPCHSALFVAAELGHDEIVRTLLQRGMAVNIANRGTGLTALHGAISKGQTSIMQTLLAYGAEVDGPDDADPTPLQSAIHSVKHFGSKAVKLLLEQGADCNVPFASPPLVAAIQVANEEVVGLLLEYGANPNQEDDIEGTPLIVAAKKGNVHMIENIIHHGADLMTGTPLMEAIRRGHFELARRLVDMGADVHKVQLLKTSHDPKSWEWFFWRGLTYRALEETTRKEECAKIDSVCSSTKRISAANRDRRADKAMPDWLKRTLGRYERVTWTETPLWLASTLGDWKTVELLLQKGSDIESRGGCDMTPLQAAIVGSHREVIDELLKAGASEDVHLATDVDLSKELSEVLKIVDSMSAQQPCTGNDLEMRAAFERYMELEGVEIETFDTLNDLKLEENRSGKQRETDEKEVEAMLEKDGGLLTPGMPQARDELSPTREEQLQAEEAITTATKLMEKVSSTVQMHVERKAIEIGKNMQDVRTQYRYNTS